MSDTAMQDQLASLQAQIDGLKSLVNLPAASSRPAYDATDDVARIETAITDIKNAIASAKHDAIKAASAEAQAIVAKDTRQLAKMLAEVAADGDDQVIKQTQVELNKHRALIDSAAAAGDRFKQATALAATISGDFILASIKTELES